MCQMLQVHGHRGSLRTDDIRCRNMNEKWPVFDVLDRHRAQNISVRAVHMIVVVNYIKRQKRRTTKDRDPKEEPAHEAEKPEEGHGVQSNFLEQLRFLGMNHR